jgi:hypothetical protein
MKRRMLSSSVQAVMVQKVRLRSARNAPPRNPGDAFTWLCERSALNANEGKNRIDRTRKRVTLTNGIPLLQVVFNTGYACPLHAAAASFLGAIIGARKAAREGVFQAPFRLNRTRELLFCRIASKRKP